MERIPLPEKLDLSANNKSASWRLFKQTWTNYEIASDLTEQAPEKRAAVLLSILGKEALQVYNTFSWSSEADMRNTCKILEKFDEYCTPRCNLTFERHQFNTRKQGRNETVDDYITQLKLLSENCEYGQLKDSIIRDIFIIGITDSHLRESMLREPNLPLEKAINMARASERAKNENTKIVTDGEIIHGEINRIDKSNKASTDNVIRCKFCNRDHIRNKKFCPANGKTCNKCGKKNHFSAACLSKTHDVRTVEENESHDSDDFEII